MKKLLLSFTALSMFAITVISCNNGETKTDNAATKDSTAVNKPADATAAMSSDMPTFSSDEVNKGLADFKALMDDYTKAIGSKDQAKITELATKYQAWSQNAASWVSKLKPEETQKFSECIQMMNKEWTDAVTKAAH
ncbi:MAG: hypothetical protein LBE82_11260 [Chitinophagaceae bacterium]|jgi:hypothetical protein|nr:hypothetical protein [Chitinophagaceae bacterium]